MTDNNELRERLPVESPATEPELRYRSADDASDPLLPTDYIDTLRAADSDNSGIISATEFLRYSDSNQDGVLNREDNGVNALINEVYATLFMEHAHTQRHVGNTTNHLDGDNFLLLEPAANYNWTVSANDVAFHGSRFLDNILPYRADTPPGMPRMPEIADITFDELLNAGVPLPAFRTQNSIAIFSDEARGI